MSRKVSCLTNREIPKINFIETRTIKLEHFKNVVATHTFSCVEKKQTITRDFFIAVYPIWDYSAACWINRSSEYINNSKIFTERVGYRASGDAQIGT